MRMRLIEKNISHVFEHVNPNGWTYGWYVAMKSTRVSDSRSFIHYDPDTGKTTDKWCYPATDLPKEVQKFINSHERRERSKVGEYGIYVYG